MRINFMARVTLAATLLFCLASLNGCGDNSTAPTAPSVSSIEVNPAKPQFAAGTSLDVTATAIYTDHTHADVTAQAAWSSSNTKVATVNGGVLAGVAAGTSVLTATMQGVSGATTLTVTPAKLVSIAVTPPHPSIALGTTQQFTATGTYTDNSTQNLTNQVTWSSDNTTVAVVSNASGSSGLARNGATGSAQVTATLGTVSSTRVTLTVTPATLVSIAVTPPSSSTALGTTQQFTATGTYTDKSTQNVTMLVSWFSNNAAVTISNASGSQGLASSAATGSAHVTAALGAVSSAPVTLTVTSATLVSIAVTPPSPSIALGTTQQLTATGTYTDNSIQNLTNQVTWSSDNSTVAVVSNASGSSGLATTVVIGSAQVSATLGPVNSAPVTLTVTAATLASIAVTPPSLSIALGTTQQFTATGTYTDNSTQNLTNQVTWASDNMTIATISNASGSQGLASSAATGSAHVIAMLGALSSAPVTLTITAATLVSIAVTPPSPSIALGTTQQFSATGTYTDNSTQNLTNQVTWASDNTVVATISSASGSQGLASSAATGGAGVTATLGAMNSAPVTLTVTPATLVSIAVTPPSPSIALGTTQQLAATGTYTDNSTQNLTNQVTWTSDNTGVATISNASGSQGVASSAATGNAHVSATLGAVNSAPVTLTVTPATLVSIAVTSSSSSIALGTTQQFTATGTYTDNSTQDLTNQVTWSSNNTAVATISNASGSQGLASSAATGSAQVSATLGSVSSGAVTLTVTPATLVSIAVTPSSPSIGLGTTQQFAATGTYTDNSTQDLTNQVTWSSNNTAIATISNASGSLGLASSAATGSAQVSATLGSMSSAPVTLTVTPATLVSIAVTPSSPSIALGTTQQFIATGTYTDNSTQVLTLEVTWASDTTSVATISNASGTQGVATGMAYGTANISAALVSVSSNSVPLTVMPTTTFSAAGSYSWTVPSGVTSVQVVVTGGAGGAGSGFAGSVGGNGGIVTSTLTVNPGDALAIIVGGGGGYNGTNDGGGGGGSSSVNAGTANQMVAGGGGGGCGGTTDAGANGNGGNATGGGDGGSGGIGGTSADGAARGGNGNGGAGGNGAGLAAAGGFGGSGGGNGAAGVDLGGGGGGGYGGGGSSPFGGGGGGSIGPAGSTYTLASNGGSGIAGRAGSVVITAL